MCPQKEKSCPQPRILQVETGFELHVWIWVFKSFRKRQKWKCWQSYTAVNLETLALHLTFLGRHDPDLIKHEKYEELLTRQEWRGVDFLHLKDFCWPFSSIIGMQKGTSYPDNLCCSFLCRKSCGSSTGVSMLEGWFIGLIHGHSTSHWALSRLWYLLISSVVHLFFLVVDSSPKELFAFSLTAWDMIYHCFWDRGFIFLSHFWVCWVFNFFPLPHSPGSLVFP